MTDEHKQRLLNRLDERARRFDANGMPFAPLPARAARDILAMLQGDKPDVPANVPELSPCITFEPWEPGKPINWPLEIVYNGYNAFRIADKALAAGMSRKAFESQWEELRPDPGSIVGIDVSEPEIGIAYKNSAPPPTPETLADVPDWVVAECDYGEYLFRNGDDVWLLGREHPFDIRPVNGYPPSSYKITRVIGRPVWKEHG